MNPDEIELRVMELAETGFNPDSPRIGIFKDIPDAEYHKAVGASASRLKVLDRSPAHCREEMDNPKEPSDALKFGSAAHCCILQPHLFNGSYIVATKCAAITGKGHQCENDGWKFVEGRWYCGTHFKGDGEMVLQKLISQDTYDRVHFMADAVQAHSSAAELLRTTDREVSFFWRELETGVLCKGRADILPGYGIIGDLKTTEDASEEAFAAKANTFGYYLQAAHYIDGLTTLKHPAEEFRIIAVEKTPPFGVQVFTLSMEDIQRGFDRLQKLLKLWKWCMETGNWPCYPQTVQKLSLSVWAAKKMEIGTERETV